jgi:hypothetical protein
MSSCTSCGHQLGVGRFCTSCGAAVDSSNPEGTPVGNPVGSPVTEADWRTDTAERRRGVGSTDPRTPPASVAPPLPPRYPLFADEVPGYTPYGPLTTVSPEPPAPAVPMGDQPGEPVGQPVEPGYEPYGYDYDYDEERRSPVLWILTAALVLVLVAAGWWFVVRDDGSAKAPDPGGSPSAGQGSPSSAVEGTDVAGRAAARAPRTAPPHADVNGDEVSYDASNMLDGVPETAWRAAGDGTGLTLSFRLSDPTELHQVGLVNGYAKTSTDSKGRTFDWYRGNRRLEEVVWTFDDGSKVRQKLEETRELQLVDVPAVVTSKVLLRILKVSAPGNGTASRDFTAISEVSLVGDAPS